MSRKFLAVTAHGVRFPTSGSPDGFDSLNKAWGYSAGLARSHSDGDARLIGDGLTFTLGCDGEVRVAADDPG